MDGNGVNRDLTIRPGPSGLQFSPKYVTGAAALGPKGDCMIEDPVIPSMPLRLYELQVLMHSLKVGFESDLINTEEKEIVRRLMTRIDRFAERQGAYWDKLV